MRRVGENDSTIYFLAAAGPQTPRRRPASPVRPWRGRQAQKAPGNKERLELLSGTCQAWTWRLDAAGDGTRAQSFLPLLSEQGSPKKILKINKNNVIIVSFFCPLIYRKDVRLSELLVHISNSNSMVLELNTGCVEPVLSGGDTHGLFPLSPS